MPPLILPPSTDTSALARAILQASDDDVPLLLETGTHFTAPGRNPAIQIGANGLRIMGSASHDDDAEGPAIIARPDGAVDPQRVDFNHGLFLVPARPTPAEVGGIVWRTHRTAGTGAPFEFGIIVRGDVEITNLTVDCNMAAQGLANLDPHVAEHSSMLAFAGQGYNVTPSPAGVPRRVFVAFRSVALRNVHTVRGGFADDIWFTRGYFAPNIENVMIDNVTDAGRVNPRRATIGFSGMCQNIHIDDSDVYSLHLEESEPYDQQPRASDVFQPSKWTLTDVTAAFMNLSTKGRGYTLDATNLNVTRAFAVSQAGGTIKDSTLHIGQGTRMDRMNDFTFENVAWHLSPDPAGKVWGIKPVPLSKVECSVSFRNNRFVIDGTALTGSSLVISDHHVDPDDKVTISLIGCSYPEPFGRSAAMPIAYARTRGLWTIALRDLGDRNRDTAIQQGADAKVVFV